jgi:hypothetical protein
VRNPGLHSRGPSVRQRLESACVSASAASATKLQRECECGSTRWPQVEQYWPAKAAPQFAQSVGPWVCGDRLPSGAGLVTGGSGGKLCTGHRHRSRPLSDLIRQRILTHRLRCGKRFTAYCRIGRVEDREAIDVCHVPNRNRIAEIQYAMSGSVKRRPQWQACTVWIA